MCAQYLAPTLPLVQIPDRTAANAVQNLSSSCLRTNQRSMVQPSNPKLSSLAPLPVHATLDTPTVLAQGNRDTVCSPSLLYERDAVSLAAKSISHTQRPQVTCPALNVVVCLPA